MKTIVLLAMSFGMAISLAVDTDPDHFVQWPPVDAPEMYPENDPRQIVIDLEQAATERDIPARLLVAMAQVESGFDPNAVSHAGAVGLVQVVPASAGREVYRLLGRDGQPTAEALFDPKYNAEIAAEYIRWLKAYFGNNAEPEIVVAAFNAGPDRVRRCLLTGDRWRSCLPEETRNYLVRVDRAAGGLSWSS
jgi:soluble lytic murein transglycosylase-like protein